MKYDVTRHHIGDKAYEPGDTREANEAEVSHLVRSGVLVSAGAKAAETNLNKAAPANSDKNAEGAANNSGGKTAKAKAG